MLLDASGSTAWTCWRRLVPILLALLLPAGGAGADSQSIVVDGAFSDWAGIEPLYTDPAGDGGGGAFDFGRLWVADDGEHLFLRVELGRELNLQARNEVVLLLDTDATASTGKATHGLGVELVWDFGGRPGRCYSGAGSIGIVHSEIGLVTAPTVTASQFEIAVDLDARPEGHGPLFPGRAIAIGLYVEGGGDTLPDAGHRATYALGSRPVPETAARSLEREDARHLRVLSYNILRDGLFDPERAPAFRRILNAVNADIVGFQEFDRELDAGTVAGVRAMLPGSDGAWHLAKVADNVAASRYPIRESREVSGNGAFRLDLSSRGGGELLLLVAHPPCCDRNEARQAEIDALMAFVRDVKAGTSGMAVPPGTPILIVGDMNLVGYARQLRTLLTGEIVDRAAHGPAFEPDWDGTALADAVPRHVASPMTFTWYGARSSFTPGRLDYIIYTDSVLSAANRFVLFTPEMPADLLAAHGLQSTDAVTASDHLPVVCDFVLRSLE